MNKSIVQNIILKRFLKNMKKFALPGILFMNIVEEEDFSSFNKSFEKI
jgi:hypothetical protein